MKREKDKDTEYSWKLTCAIRKMFHRETHRPTYKKPKGKYKQQTDG